MGTLWPNARESNLQHGKHSEKRLLVSWIESFDAFGRRCGWRIVDVLRCKKLLSNFSKASLEVGAAYDAAEGGAVTKEQALELVHHHKGMKRLESNLRDQIIP